MADNARQAGGARCEGQKFSALKALFDHGSPQIFPRLPNPNLPYHHSLHSVNFFSAIAFKSRAMMKAKVGGSGGGGGEMVH